MTTVEPAVTGAGQDGAPSLDRLLETWQDWSLADLHRQAVTVLEARGEHGRARLLTKYTTGPDPLAALAANRELVSLLSGWQWHAIRHAREQGATWQQIGDTLGVTADQARDQYTAKIENAERHPGVTDTGPYRAVLDDLPQDAAGRPRKDTT